MKTEIFGTFGPACSSEEKLKKMIEVGMTGMRLNLSHTTLADSENYIRNYKSAAVQMGTNAQILIDLQGPELRVGNLASPMTLREDNQVKLCTKEKCQSNMISVPAEVIEVVEPGDEILLDDGRLLLKVIGEDTTLIPCEKCVFAQVLRGGELHSYKSIKIVGKNIKRPPLTEHDIDNIKVAKTYGVTALMQPFVLSGEELRYVRQVLKKHGAEDIRIYAKIENRLGVENLDDILPEADVIVIARGDLGNDMHLWELPKVQKQIEEACNKVNKPYIVVTQMLASMEENPVPTRAEVSDIFHAVYHGAWGVMVTGETAVGKYPVEVIKYLTNTVREAERILSTN